MSKFLELQAQVEKLEAEIAEARDAEIEGVIADIKHKIDAFGLTERMLFGTDLVATRAKAVAKKAGRPTKAAEPFVKPKRTRRTPAQMAEARAAEAAAKIAAKAPRKGAKRVAKA